MLNQESPGFSRGEEVKAHVSGNPVWQDWPSTATLVTAECLENIEAALDRLTPGEWQPLTLQNGWAAREPASFYTPSCRLLPWGRVEVAGTITRTTGAGNGDTIVQLPAGHRPTRETVLIAADSGGYSVSLIVRTTGVVAVASYRTTAATLTLVGTFAADGPT